MHRREFVRVTIGAGTVLAVAPSLLRALDAPVKMTVYKTASCGCCKEWVKYMEGAGFTARVIDMDDLTPIKRKNGVPEKLESCHTALVGTYVIEGHVPADLVKKILAEKPQISGLAAPGMPQSAPGMDIGKVPFEVIAWDKTAKTRVYAKR